jgi:hypothetical protein
LTGAIKGIAVANLKSPEGQIYFDEHNRTKKERRNDPQKKRDDSSRVKERTLF